MSLDLNITDQNKSALSYATDDNTTAPEIDDCIEQIMHWAEEHYGQDEIIQAREDFFDSAGKVFHDDHFFHERMSLFLDYFIFERKLQKTPTDMPESPFEVFLGQKKILISGYRHSLFETIKSDNKVLEVLDTLTKEKIKISPRGAQRFDGIRKKDLFQGFLYSIDDKSYLSHGLIFHPRDSWRLLRKEVKKWRAKNDVSQFCRSLYSWAKTHLKAMRHGHVSPKVIYKAAITG